MRYLSEETTYILGNFTVSGTVTIDIYRLSDDNQMVNAVPMSEIASTGRFKYSFSQAVSNKTEYLYICSDGIEEQQGKIILGGYPDDIKDGTDQIVDLALETTVSGIKDDIIIEMGVKEKRIKNHVTAIGA